MRHAIGGPIGVGGIQNDGLATRARRAKVQGDDGPRSAHATQWTDPARGPSLTSTRASSPSRARMITEVPGAADVLTAFAVRDPRLPAPVGVPADRVSRVISEPSAETSFASLP